MGKSTQSVKRSASTSPPVSSVTFAARKLTTALATAGAFVGSFSLLASCSTAPKPVTAAQVSSHREPASAQLKVQDNFDVAELEQHFQDVSRRAARSVVAISATDAQIDTDEAVRSEDINSDRLTALLNTVDRTVGAGFIVDSDGYILTNHHVIADAQQLWVTTDDRKVYPAIVVGADPRSDLALLKVPASGLPAARFSQAGAVQRGQWTIAIGNPYGLSAGGEMCASVGIVSATGRSLPKLAGKEGRVYSDLIQTTAQINPGNSGGPLFDLHGDVIGVNTAVILPQKQANGIGFAIPVTARLLQQIDDMKQGHEVVYAYLGISVGSPTAHERRDAGIDDELGARIDSVDEHSPASVAGFCPGDVVTAFRGHRVGDGDLLVHLVGEAPIDQPVPVVCIRHGKRLELTVRLRPREQIAQAVTADSQRFRWRGLLVGSIPANWTAGSRSHSAGVLVIGVDPSSAFVRDGIHAGAIITSVAGRPVKDIITLQKIVNDTPFERCKLRIAGGGAEVVSVGE